MTRTVFIWIGISAVLLIAIVSLGYPKELYTRYDNESIKACECLGSSFWYGSQCIGIPSNCSVVEISKEIIDCTEPTCEQTFEQIATDLEKKGKPVDPNLLTKSTASDILLIIDTSNSMEGQKFESAKRAAIKLVDNIDEKERIGIVAFSEQPRIIHNLSNDKRSLVEKISAISLSGGTKYLPSLELAEEIFKIDNRGVRKGIIFLSDGVPSDNITNILKKSESLGQQNISLFTISFGIKSENNVLKNMVIEQDPAQGERLYRSFEDTADLSEAFYEAYKELTDSRIMVINPVYWQTSVSEDDLETLSLQVFLNETLVSSEYRESTLCAPATKITVIAESDNGSTNITLRGDKDRFVFPDRSLSPGTYQLSAFTSLQIRNDGTCSFSGEKDLGKLVVSNTSCEALGCNRTQELLSNAAFALNQGTNLPRAQVQKKVVFMIDTSESMASVWHRAPQMISSLDNMLASFDQRALITFNDESHLVQELTTQASRIDGKFDKITLKGTTRLAPALKKAAALSSDAVIIITDGQPYDNKDEIRKWAQVIDQSGSCVQIIGLGTAILDDKDNLDLMKSISSCEQFSYEPNSKELIQVMASIVGAPLPKQNISVYSHIEAVSFPSKANLEVSVIGGQNALKLPVQNENTCIPLPSLKGVVVQNGKELADVDFSVVGTTYIAQLPLLLPGSYELVLDATLEADDCSMEAQSVEEFKVYGSEGMNDNYVMGAIILLFIACFVTAHHAWKLFQG